MQAFAIIRFLFGRALRHYAAHAARFLAQRCALERARGGASPHCEMKVTAVYVGWRGARINERAMHRFRVIGAWLGAVASFPTLFDRKPVSEQIAPAVMSALRSIDRALSRNDVNGKPKADARENRMIVFGHSLGGNMLATGLQDSAIKAVRNHQPGEVMPPLIGNLAVLINPASEASKWTSIQREVWRRIMFHTSEVTPFDKVLASHKFFQMSSGRLISVPSAFGFPPGRLRTGIAPLWKL